MSEHHYNPEYIHHRKESFAAASMRELVFGIEDGMVSTMGAITGIAAGTGNHFVIILSGVVIICVESISMAVGSYLSSKSHREVEKRKLFEEREEIEQHPEEEEAEMYDLFVEDGWPKALAKEMAAAAGRDKELMLKEMAYRELGIIPEAGGSAARDGVVMLFSYILGGLVPLLPYLLIDELVVAVPTSIIITLVGLFVLGGFTARFSKRSWWKAGLEMLALAGVAALVGYGVGQGVERYLME